MIELELYRIIIDEEKSEQVIILKEKQGSRLLPVMIGINEAVAIRMPLSGFLPPRPMTHDLIAALINEFDISLQRVVIDELTEGTFYAKLHFARAGSSSKIIDGRPSDCIALAVRTKAPIFVNEDVLNRLVQDNK